MGKRVAVVGAGVAGATCARRLADKGHSVVVFDKGRAIGGRLATRESRSGIAFDHGAHRVHANRPAFAHVLAKLAEAGTATRPDGPDDWVIGHPAMNRLLAPLFEGLELHLSTEIVAIIQGANGWTLASREGSPTPGFNAIAIAIPAAQATQLIVPFGLGWENALERVSYDPCLTTMLAFETPLAIPAGRAPGPEFGIAHQIRNSRKPGRPDHLDQWVVHSDTAYATAHLDDAKETIAEAMRARFLSANALPDLKPAYLAGHRWRFARTRQPLGASHLWAAEIGIGLAGDWCLGPDAEHAFESGVALAENMLSSLG